MFTRQKNKARASWNQPDVHKLKPRQGQDGTNLMSTRKDQGLGNMDTTLYLHGKIQGKRKMEPIDIHQVIKRQGQYETRQLLTW